MATTFTILSYLTMAVNLSCSFPLIFICLGKLNVLFMFSTKGLAHLTIQEAIDPV